MSLGSELEKLWLKAGYESLGQLSRRTGITVATLSRIKDDIQKPKPETLKRLAPALGVSHEYLLRLAGYIETSGIGLTDDPTETVEPKQEQKKPKDLQKFLDQQEIMFDGVPLTEDDKEKIRKALELIFWDAKQKNKEARAKARARKEGK